jgi:hypothetical protein
MSIRIPKTHFHTTGGSTSCGLHISIMELGFVRNITDDPYGVTCNNCLATYEWSRHYCYLSNISLGNNTDTIVQFDLETEQAPKPTQVNPRLVVRTKRRVIL